MDAIKKESKKEAEGKEEVLIFIRCIRALANCVICRQIRTDKILESFYERT